MHLSCVESYDEQYAYDIGNNHVEVYNRYGISSGQAPPAQCGTLM